MFGLGILEYPLNPIYCRVPARQGLQRTALAPGRDKTRASDPLVHHTDRLLKIKKNTGQY